MDFHFKDIHIGKMIAQLVNERQIDSARIAKFLRIEEAQIERMYQSKSLDTEILLLWSKLLEYDFFRLYSQHILLYAPLGAAKPNSEKPKNTTLPQFKKQLYTPEIIEFIVELVEKNKKTKQEIIEQYRIPKTTLYKWLRKHKKTED